MEKKKSLFGLKKATYTFAPEHTKQRFTISISASGLFKESITPSNIIEIDYLIDRGILMLNAMKEELNKELKK